MKPSEQVEQGGHPLGPLTGQIVDVFTPAGTVRGELIHFMLGSSGELAWLILKDKTGIERAILGHAAMVINRPTGE